MTTKKIKQRLEYLRGELRAERISYEELHELQCLAAHIDAGDVELLEAAGVPEFPESSKSPIARGKNKTQKYWLYEIKGQRVRIQRIRGRLKPACVRVGDAAWQIGSAIIREVEGKLQLL